MSGAANRRKGHNFEREIRLKLKELFPDCETSRYESKKLDDAKVDLTQTDPFYFQCKAYKTNINNHDIIAEMPQDEHFNVVLHKRPQKGTVVTMMWDDFYELLGMMRKEGIL